MISLIKAIMTLQCSRFYEIMLEKVKHMDPAAAQNIDAIIIITNKEVLKTCFELSCKHEYKL